VRVTYGSWVISTGKGDRHYINLIGDDGIIHPNEIAAGNGLGSYGWGNLKDLAIALQLFEKAVNVENSIEAAVESIGEPLRGS